MDAAESSARSCEQSSPTPARSESQSSDLTPRELEILTFERQWWRYQGAKEQAIREQFHLSSTRYYQVLNRLLEKPAAMRADPMLVKRLRRVRASRQRTRTAHKLGIDLP